MTEKENFLVYENWRAEKKAVVHKGSYSFIRDGHARLHEENEAPNDKWHGYFNSEAEAINFANKLPDRQLKLCKRCMF